MLEEMGIDTGVDMDRLIDCVWMLEEILGRTTMGHVSKAGPRPQSPEEFYDPNAPFIETFEEAKHFKLGPGVYEGGIYPWREPIRSHQRPETLSIVNGAENIRTHSARDCEGDRTTPSGIGPAPSPGPQSC